MVNWLTWAGTMHITWDGIIGHQWPHAQTVIHQCRWKLGTKVVSKTVFLRLMYSAFFSLDWDLFLASYSGFLLTMIFVSYIFSLFLPSSSLTYSLHPQIWKLDILFLLFCWLFNFFTCVLNFTQYLYFP